ncbi:hypothetical protein BC940DRAFT_171690 [Gongronella butleri]|nr:hypothetical protein BC940DRAFT_171690 [Gongronella butleri]
MYSDTKCDEIKACLLGGMSMTKTAYQCGVSTKVVHNVRRKFNLPQTHERIKRCSTSTIKKIQQLAYQGKTASHTAAACSVSRSTVLRYRSQRGFTRPRFSDVKKQQIIKNLLDGVSVSETACINKISPNAIQFPKFDNNIHTLGEKATYEQDAIEKIQRQLLADEPLKKIAADCGTTLNLVKMVKRKFGINNKKLSNDKIDKIIQCVARGMSTDMASKACDVSPYLVRKICKARNIALPGSRYIKPATKKEIKRRLEQGESLAAVAKACGVSERRMYYFKKAANLIESPSKRPNSSPQSMCQFRFVTEREKQLIKHFLLSGMPMHSVVIAVAAQGGPWQK